MSYYDFNNLATVNKLEQGLNKPLANLLILQ